jgi:cobalamin-dependent methionine synthase I
MAEKVAEKIQDEIKQSAQGQAEAVSNRYSPGYCGWSVADQHLLFSFLPANFCGITLNESALMHPIKSVSGIIGIGKEMVKNPYQCNICDVTDCIMSPATKQV